MQFLRIIQSVALALLSSAAVYAQTGPQPKVVNTGAPGQPPSDAIVLFDGTHAREWVHKDGRPAEWKLEAGALVCNSGKGDLHSKRKSGSAQFHIEFSAPFMPNAKSQAAVTAASISKTITRFRF